MKIIYFPKWNLSLLINLHNKVQNSFINSLLDKYQSYLERNNIELNYFSKIKNYDRYFRIDDLQGEIYKNSSKDDKQIIDDILKSNKIGIINDPEYYLFLNYINTYPNKDQNYYTFIINILHNCKKMLEL